MKNIFCLKVFWGQGAQKMAGGRKKSQNIKLFLTVGEKKIKKNKPLGLFSTLSLKASNKRHHY